MYIISKKAIELFAQQYPEFKNSLYDWYKIISKTNFSISTNLQNTFSNADVFKGTKNNLAIFNIHGDKVRLIASIHYNTNKLYIRNIMTHIEYNKHEVKV